MDDLIRFLASHWNLLMSTLGCIFAFTAAFFTYLLWSKKKPNFTANFPGEKTYRILRSDDITTIDLVISNKKRESVDNLWIYVLIPPAFELRFENNPEEVEYFLKYTKDKEYSSHPNNWRLRFVVPMLGPGYSISLRIPVKTPNIARKYYMRYDIFSRETGSQGSELELRVE